MIETLQTILTSIRQWLTDHYLWVIGSVSLPIILFWLSQRGKKIEPGERMVEADKDDADDKITHRKKIELQEREVEAYEDDVDDSIAHRSFIRNVIIGAGTLWLFAWLFGDEDAK